MRIAGPDADGEGQSTDDLVSAAELQGAVRGLWSLDKGEPFHLLCFHRSRLAGPETWARRRAERPPTTAGAAGHVHVESLATWSSVEAVLSTTSGSTSSAWGLPPSSNAALYFPRIRAADAVPTRTTLDCAPCCRCRRVCAD